MSIDVCKKKKCTMGFHFYRVVLRNVCNGSCLFLFVFVKACFEVMLALRCGVIFILILFNCRKCYGELNVKLIIHVI